MTLISTTSEFKKYISIDANTNIETLQPYIEEAQTLYIQDLLGESFLTSLIIDYNDGGASGDNVVLLPLIQRALAYYTMYQGADHLSVNIGDAGINQTRGQDSEPAPKWKVESLKLNYITQGDLHAEKLLAFLESQASPSKYNEWYASNANTVASGLIVPNAHIASDYIDINESRRLFKRLKKRVKEIEQGLVKRLIGTGQYEEIITQIKADSLTSVNTNLIDMLRPIIAKKALYESIPLLKLSITDSGLTIFSSNDSIVTKSAANKEDTKDLRYSLKESDSGYEAGIDKLKEFIIDNVSDYPLIESSTAYTSRPDPGPKRPPVNLPNSKHFSV